MSPIDLLRLLVRLDGFMAKPDHLLSAESIQLMSTPSVSVVGGFRSARPWVVNDKGYNGWFHIGILAGSACLALRPPRPHLN